MKSTVLASNGLVAGELQLQNSRYDVRGWGCSLSWPRSDRRIKLLTTVECSHRQEMCENLQYIATRLRES